jgi:hypothetical protein
MIVSGNGSCGRDTTIWVLTVAFLVATSTASDGITGPAVLDPASFKRYVDTFNENDEELHAQHIPNEKAWGFLKENIPLFHCPDEDFERTYYFRWWTYRKHIKHTADGFVVTEFLPEVGWSGKHNTINCPAGHHFYEGRWLHNQKYLDDYAVFWFRKGGSLRSYSFWAADALWGRFLFFFVRIPMRQRETRSIVLAWLTQSELSCYTKFCNERSGRSAFRLEGLTSKGLEESQIS